ncbi:MAG TPA: hypothetical protein VLT83_15900 [Opitutaceae bacterium]|nr:hypothetical protein [Opitutaceae bacterium]
MKHLALVLLFLSAAAMPAAEIMKSGDWDRLENGEYLLENNVWNVAAARPGRAWSQSIFCDRATGAMGWRWNFAGEDATLKTFPELIFGKKPFDNYVSTTPRLPAPLTACRLVIDYDYVANATGVYDTSTDIGFTDSAAAGERNIRAKLMIWFDHQHLPFFPDRRKIRATISGRAHEVFIDRDHAGADGRWVFIALLPENLPRRGELHLADYLAYLVRVGALEPEWFLASVEIGSEIASGSGEVTFRKFVVR